MSRLSEKLRVTFSRLVLEWGISTRYLIELPVTFKIVRVGRERKTSKPLTGKTYDLSESGIGILSEVISSDGLHAHFSNDMSANTNIEIELILPERTLSLVGETCRYQKLERNEYTYLLGIKIVKISPEDRLYLQRYLNRLKRESQRRTPRY